MSNNYNHAIDIPPRINIETLNEILSHMEDIGGSDLFIMGKSEVWMDLHGKKTKATKRRLSDKEVFSVIESIYGTNATSKLGTGVPIDTSYEFKTEQRDSNNNPIIFRHRFRVNAVSCLRGGRQSLTITMRTIPTTPLSLSALGVEDDIVDTCEKTLQGLILVVGSTGSGKSTLLSSLLRHLLENNEANLNLITIEDPIEFVYDDIIKPSSFVSQLEVGRNIPSFSDGVINSLRMKPDAILVGEARDFETISSSVEASATGHVVFSTVHANTVAETLQRMVAVYPHEMQEQAKYDLVQSLKMIVAQRLVKTVDGKRTAIKEFLIFNQEIKERLIKATNIALEAFELVETMGSSMLNDIQNKFDKGIISENNYNKLKINYNNKKSSH